MTMHFTIPLLLIRLVCHGWLVTPGFNRNKAPWFQKVKAPGVKVYRPTWVKVTKKLCHSRTPSLEDTENLLLVSSILI